LEKQINNASNHENTTKAVLDQLTDKLHKLERNEEAAQDAKTHQSNLSKEDVKKDFNKMQEQLQHLEHMQNHIQGIVDGSTIESKNTKMKLMADIELLMEKVKSFSVIIKDDKYKNEEKLVKLEIQVGESNKDNEKIQQKITDLETYQAKIEKNITLVQDENKSCVSRLHALQLDCNNDKIKCENVNTEMLKNVRTIQENTGKISDCMQDYESMKESFDKLNKKVDKRPAAASAEEELDKKSKLSNQLFNDLSTRIDDVESSISKQSKTTKTEFDKINNNIKDVSTTASMQQNNNSQLSKDMTMIKTDMGTVKSLIGDVKSIIKDITKLQEIVEAAKGRIDKIENPNFDVIQVLKDVKNIEKEIEEMKNLKKSSLEVVQLLKDVTILKENVETLTKISKSTENKSSVMEKEVKNASTELKYIDSLLKKETANTKTELSNFGKTLKSNDKDILSLQNMVEVLNDSLKTESTATASSEKINKIQNEITALGADIKGYDKTLNETKDVLQKKQDNAVKDIEAKIKNCKDDLTQKLSTCISDFKNLGSKVDTNVTEIKNLSDYKEENKSVFSKITNELKGFEKKIDTVTKDVQSQSNDKEIKMAKEETKTLDKKITDVDQKISKLQKETLQSSTSLNKSNEETKNIKKDIEKINQEVKESLLKHEGKVTELKSSFKEANDKIVKLEKAQSVSKPAQKDNSEELKKEIDKMNQQIKDNLKSCQDKGVQQEVQFREVKTSIKDVNDQLVVQVAKLSAKMEKDGRATPKPGPGSESAKLLTLSKAIDSIQDNTKSLETMVTKMKSEFPTAMDLEKLRSELKGGDLQNHPDMGPIMDSLIMTNDRPYVDCSTMTPMTGNGLVKFERFNAMNKLPWDDVGDQFVIQEPGVYCVNVTAILQDAGLSIKLASPMLEREVASLGSREGLLGSSCPAFVSRSALFQIDDDENCVETVLVEIHADNEDSFIDKNVTLTMFKIAEGSGQNDE